MTDQSKKYKEIACAFSRYDQWAVTKDTEDAYFDWLLTEEGKRLTAEEEETMKAYNLSCQRIDDLTRQLDERDIVISGLHALIYKLKQSS